MSVFSIDNEYKRLIKHLMKFRLYIFAAVIFAVSALRPASANAQRDTTVYLITCGPGTETYSIYGHSALRVVIPSSNTDLVYNWGVFDFSTKHFAWKFAKGRLNYMLIAEPVNGFLQTYVYEKRFVIAQKLNLDGREMNTLLSLINENMKPENVTYRYDFFYDDCSTRIRDLIEKSVGKNLKYPENLDTKKVTFRDLVAKYQEPYPWLRFGVDLIMGSTADKKAGLRDKMFLPVDMQQELSDTYITRSGKMIPLLQNPVTILDNPEPAVKANFFLSPPFILALAIIFVILFGGMVRNAMAVRIFDIALFSVFSILAVLMIFFNFFTDHAQMRSNFNIIWLNPFIIACLVMLILNKSGQVWFRIVFVLSVFFLAAQLILPQDFTTAFSLLTILILIRSSVRCGFSWNPLSLPDSDK